LKSVQIPEQLQSSSEAATKWYVFIFLFIAERCRANMLH
jgi:T-complex protein 1 subunit epsilon